MIESQENSVDAMRGGIQREKPAIQRLFSIVPRFQYSLRTLFFLALMAGVSIKGIQWHSAYQKKQRARETWQSLCQVGYNPDIHLANFFERYDRLCEDLKRERFTFDDVGVSADERIDLLLAKAKKSWETANRPDYVAKYMVDAMREALMRADVVSPGDAPITPLDIHVTEEEIENALRHEEWKWQEE